MQLQLHNITYTYPEATSPVFNPITTTFPQGWTGIIGDNGCGKTTFASIAARILKPNSGNITPTLFSVYCPQDSAIVPDNLFDLAYDWGREGRTIKEALTLEDDWFWRFDTLSGGQQKRVQIGCALYARPDVLVTDEPTNNLDTPTKAYVHDALASYRGIGILISHDRALLDSLVEQSLIFEDGCARMRPGGYTQASTQAEQDQLERKRNALMQHARQSASKKRQIAGERMLHVKKENAAVQTLIKKIAMGANVLDALSCQGKTEWRESFPQPWIEDWIALKLNSLVIPSLNATPHRLKTLEAPHASRHLLVYQKVCFMQEIST